MKKNISIYMDQELITRLKEIASVETHGRYQTLINKVLKEYILNHDPKARADHIESIIGKFKEILSEESKTKKSS